MDPAGEKPHGTLWTIGHSTREWDAFIEILHAAAIECLVDVRRFAGSRRNPQYSPLAMAPPLAASLLERDGFSVGDRRP